MVLAGRPEDVEFSGLEKCNKGSCHLPMPFKSLDIHLKCLPADIMWCIKKEAFQAAFTCLPENR